MDFLKQLLQYNEWANERLLNLIPELPPRDLDVEMPGSFPTLRKTWYHIWDAETIWLQRLKGHSTSNLPSQMLTGRSEENASDGFENFQLYLLQTSTELKDLVNSQADAWFNVRCVYRSIDQKSHQSAHASIVQHVANHSAFHRGQIVSFCRHLGLTKFPSTDFIRWQRDQEPRDVLPGDLQEIYG